MRRCHPEMRLWEMTKGNMCCKDHVDQIVTGQEIVIRRKSVFQSVEEKNTANEVAVVLKGE